MFCGYSTSASNTRCFSVNDGMSLCYIQPDPPLALSWSDAMEWCRNIGATLPITDRNFYNTVYGNVLDYFGILTETLWLGANSTNDPNNWYWANGSVFTGMSTLLLFFWYSPRRHYHCLLNNFRQRHNIIHIIIASVTGLSESYCIFWPWPWYEVYPNVLGNATGDHKTHELHYEWGIMYEESCLSVLWDR